MPLLHVALQEGFADDSVEIRINGEQVLSRRGVSTRQQIGLADTLEREVAADRVELTVSLPNKSLSRTATLSLAGPTYVGVSLGPQGITFNVSDEPFGYL